MAEDAEPATRTKSGMEKGVCAIKDSTRSSASVVLVIPIPATTVQIVYVTTATTETETFVSSVIHLAVPALVLKPTNVRHVWTSATLSRMGIVPKKLPVSQDFIWKEPIAKNVPTTVMIVTICTVATNAPKDLKP